MTHRGPFQPLLFCDSVNRARPTSGKKKGFCDSACRQETLVVSLDRSPVEQTENLLLAGKLFSDHHRASALHCLSCRKASSSL